MSNNDVAMVWDFITEHNGVAQDDGSWEIDMLRRAVILYAREAGMAATRRVFVALKREYGKPVVE